MPMAARVPNEMRRIVRLGSEDLRRCRHPDGEAKRREGTHAKGVKYSSNEKKVDFLSSLSQHTAAAAASARRARRTSRFPCRTWYLAMTVPRRRLLYAARRKHASFWSSSSPTASSTDTELSSTCATTCGVVRGGV